MRCLHCECRLQNETASASEDFVLWTQLGLVPGPHFVPNPLSGHFGPRTLRHQDTSALNYSAEVSGQFGTSAEVSQGHWCRSVRTSNPLYFRPTRYKYLTPPRSVVSVFFKYQWIKWKIRGRGTVHSSWASVCGCGPLAAKVSPQLC